MDLELNNLQMKICHKTKPNQTKYTSFEYIYIYIYILIRKMCIYCGFKSLTDLTVYAFMTIFKNLTYVSVSVPQEGVFVT